MPVVRQAHHEWFDGGAKRALRPAQSEALTMITRSLSKGDELTMITRSPELTKWSKGDSLAMTTYSVR
jgi:hypothetical protein